MRTKWGSCNRESGHIWFNLDLTAKHSDGLDFIVVHEMARLIERGDGTRFTRLMDDLLPSWRRRDELNRTQLVHEPWGTYG